MEYREDEEREDSDLVDVGLNADAVGLLVL